MDGYKKINGRIICDECLEKNPEAGKKNQKEIKELNRKKQIADLAIMYSCAKSEDAKLRLQNKMVSVTDNCYKKLATQYFKQYSHDKHIKPYRHYAIKLFNRVMRKYHISWNENKFETYSDLDFSLILEDPLICFLSGDNKSISLVSELENISTEIRVLKTIWNKLSQL